MGSRLRITLAVLVSVAVIAGLGFFLFERHERGGLAATAQESCAGKTASTASELPLQLPLTEGAKVLRVDTQGKTTVAFASLPGNRDDLVAKRDTVLEDLKSAGYKVTGTDQEPTYEAEAQFAGPHDGSLRVKPLCTGLLEVRYKIEQ